MPLPATVRDAVLVRLAPLSDGARAAAETAAVAGAQMDLALVAGLAGEAAIGELLAVRAARRDGGRRRRVPSSARARRRLRGRAVAAPPRAAPRDRRRAALAAAATPARSPATGSPPATRRARWRRCARRSPTARPSTPTATPPGSAGRRFEIWPEGEQGAERVTALEQHARCAELAGDLIEAARAQRDVVAARRGLRRRPRAGRRRAPDGVDLRAPGRPCARPRRAPRGGGGVRGQRAAGRGRGRAARDRGLPAVGRAARRGAGHRGRGAPGGGARRARGPAGAIAWASRAWRA